MAQWQNVYVRISDMYKINYKLKGQTGKPFKILNFYQIVEPVRVCLKKSVKRCLFVM